MSSISLLALLGLIMGIIAERKGYTSIAWNRIASKMLVQVIYPCLIFASLLGRFRWHEVLSLAPMPIFLAVILFLGLAFGRLSLSRSGLAPSAIPTRRAYVFLSIMPNYSFVPLVVAQFFWGERGVALVAITSVAADVFLWTFAYPQIAGRTDWRKLFSPALITLLIAFTLLYLAPDLSLSPWAEGLTVLGWIGKITLPLSMYILGTQLARATKRLEHRRAHGLLLFWRLFAAPLIMLGLIAAAGSSLPAEAKAVALLVASMPGAVITVVLAQLHEADGKFAATQILLGHILGLVTASLWQLALWLSGL